MPEKIWHGGAKFGECQISYDTKVPHVWKFVVVSIATAMEANRLCFLLLLAAARWRAVELQATAQRQNIGNCASLPTPEEIGRTDMISLDGYVAGLANSYIMPPSRAYVQIIGVNFVCQASGTVRGTVSSVSFVVEYVMCQAADGVNCETRLEQLQFDCAAVAADPDGGDPKMNVYSFDPNSVVPMTYNSILIRTLEFRISANLSTPFEDQCGDCADGHGYLGLPAAPDTHCIRMLTLSL